MQKLNESTTLTSEEKQILTVKYQGKRIADLSIDEIIVAAQTLIFKIYAITGWAIPANEIQDIFIDQLYKKMYESYKNLTIAEVEYAFRNYGTTVKDWGKQMNLALIDEVINAYLSARSEVSKLEQSIKKELPAPQESLSDEAMQDWLNHIKADPRLEFMPVMLYDWAEKKGLINYSTAQKKEFYQQAINRTFNQLLAAAQDYIKSEYQLTEDQNKLAAFTQMKFNNKFSEDEKKRLITMAKKIALFEYLKTIV